MKKFLLILFSILVFTIPTGCGKQVFDGSRTSNDVQFIMDYSVLSKTETHEMKLKQGSIINVIIANKSGRVDILMKNVDGQEIYRGDSASSGNFSIKISKTGTYKISVTGSKAKGSVSFKVAE